MIGLDIETKKIVKGAPLLPEPVGCSIHYDDGEVVYYAWGHPTDNNCVKEEFRNILLTIWDQPFVTHNGLGFDVPVLEHWFDMPPRNPMLTEDTLFLAYLHDPHAKALGLKPLAEDWLGMPPDDQQALHNWIMQNTDCKNVKEAGAYISEAPGDLVGSYANSDTSMTIGLYEHLKEVRQSMLSAYNRERRLAPILADLQHKGVRVDLGRLKEDYHTAMMKKHKLEQLIREHLHQGPSFNPGSDKELGAVLLELGYEGFLTTPKGKLSMSRPSLESVLQNDPELMSLLKSRSVYDTLTGTFMGPWIKFAEANGGRIHASYNQVRNPDGYGTRTGRLSSNDPNFQNVPKGLGMDYFGEPFPEMRTYLLPDVGQLWMCGDFKNQEPRLAAHYEAGALLEAFLANPGLDPYMFVADVCKVLRNEAKIIFLGLLYAMGAALLAEKLHCTYEYATSLRNVIRANLPDIQDLDKDCKARFTKGLPIRTLGGREYYCEPASNGRRWEYKALNTLIQGSAADQNKEAMIYMAPRLVDINGRLLGTVHDEISVSAEERYFDYVKEIMHEAANALACDCPMLMDVGMGNNWSEAKP